MDEAKTTTPDLFNVNFDPAMLKFAVKRKPVELFHEAVHSKDVLRVTFLLEQSESHFHVDEIDEDGITALQRSCFTGPLKLVQLLVAHDADMNIQDKEGWSVMHAATVARNHSIMRYLIAMGAQLGLENDQGEKAIDLARDLQSVVILAEAMRRAGLARDVDEFLKRRPEVREILEEKLQQSDAMRIELERQRSASEIPPSSMSLNAETQKRRSSFDVLTDPRPLTANVKNNDKDLMGLMGIPDISRLTGVTLPTRNLLENSRNRADLDDGERGACSFCPKCGKRRREIAKRESTASLCSNSSDSSTSSDSAYSSGSTNSAANLYSYERGNSGTITTTKENNNSRAENKAYDRIRVTSKNIYPDAVRYHTNREVQPNERFYTPQQYLPPTATEKNISFLDNSRVRASTININTQPGKCPNPERVIKTEAYHFTQRRFSSPALYYRSGVSRAPIASKIEEVIDVNELNSRGVSLLHEAAAKGDAEGVKLLLLHGAEVNRQSLNGSSPLHEAVREGNGVTASILIEHGADLFTETDNGLLPIDIARDPDIKRFIEKAMALK